MSERRRRPLYALYAATAVSRSGNVVALVAIPWFVLQETGSAALTGLTAFFTWLPVVISAFLGGAIVDRLGPRRMSVLADLASAVAVAAIPALHLTVGIELWQLIALVFLGALLDAPGATARGALLPDLVEQAGMRMERATSIAQIVDRGSILVGAPLGGLLVAGLGATTALWIDAASFLVSAVFVVGLVPVGARPEIEPGRSYLDDLLEGVRFVWNDRLLRAIVLTVLLTNFLDAPLSSVLMPVYVDQEFGSATYLGWILGTFGAASVAGAALFGAIGHRLPRRITFVLSFIVVSLPYFIFAMTPSTAVTLGAAALFGLAAAPLNPILATVEYERIPASMRGRVLGATAAGAYAAIPAGMLLGGLMVEWIGVGPTLLAIGLCYLAVTGYGLFNAAFREMDRRAELAAEAA